MQFSFAEKKTSNFFSYSTIKALSYAIMDSMYPEEVLFHSQDSKNDLYTNAFGKVPPTLYVFARFKVLTSVDTLFEQSYYIHTIMYDKLTNYHCLVLANCSHIFLLFCGLKLLVHPFQQLKYHICLFDTGLFGKIIMNIFRNFCED